MMPNTTESQGSPVLIPLLHNHSGNHDDDSSSAKLSEWAMIELNGELIAPPPSNFLQAATGKENPSVDTATTTTTTEVSFIRNDQLELGSVRFVDNVSIVICVVLIIVTLFGRCRCRRRINIIFKKPHPSVLFFSDSLSESSNDLGNT